MASSAFSGVGTVFKRGAVAVAEITNISGPNITRGTIDVTNLDSTNGYKEFIGAFRDGGEVTLSMNFTMATWQDFKDDIDDDDPVAYSIVLGNTEENTFGFDALVTSLGMAIPFDDKVSSDVALKIDGELDITS
jgi:predicted secreted protein